MARKHEHEDHVNHEAWAIPYGDLITLLLAFFVVMYAVSSVNEGKYRVLSDSMTAAFRGSPKTTAPIEIGDKVVKVRRDDTVAGLSPSQAMKLPGHVAGGDKSLVEQFNKMGRDIAGEGEGVDGPGLRQVADQVEQAMASLIGKDLVTVTRKPLWVEVEIKTDILFPSGSAEIQPDALPILDSIAGILKPLASPIRVEGHTDNRPIHTLQFPSNWELSGARASCIVRLFEQRGIAPERMSVAGQGEYQPVADNATTEGRNRNRRVTLVILDAPAGAAQEPAPATAESAAAAQEPAP
ncbi:MAG: flagellar motor protein MotD [Gammaproteobacteria bacterium]|nr:MAG: flagellar motor protein MotD [Gammaproteobacteria bacterium]